MLTLLRARLMPMHLSTCSAQARLFRRLASQRPASKDHSTRADGRKAGACRATAEDSDLLVSGLFLTRVRYVIFLLKNPSFPQRVPGVSPRNKSLLQQSGLGSLSDLQSVRHRSFSFLQRCSHSRLSVRFSSARWAVERRCW